MKQPITIFPDEEMAEKFKQGRESLGMTEEEYLAYLIEQSGEPENPEDEDEEDENDYEEPEDEDEDAENKDEDPEEDEDEEDQFSEIMAGIVDVSDKDSIIKELKRQVIAREEEVMKITDELDRVTNYPRFNLLFELVRGHTLRIGNSKHEMVIREKKDFIHCLVKNFHFHLDSEDFGIDNDEFEQMEEEAFKDA